MDELIKIDNVRKVYTVGNEKVVALDKIDLNIGRGEICCVLGTSGSGKSTLLNMIAGLEKPTSGQIKIGKYDIVKMTETQLAKFRQKHIGFVFQSYNLIAIKLRGTEGAAGNDGVDGESQVPITSKNGGKIDRLRPTGQFKANQAKDYNTMDGIFISIDFARNLQKQYAKLMGTKDSFKSYNNAKIKVDDFANVEQVEAKLKSFGFSTYSAKQELDQAKSTSKIIQLVLGALGGISLLVAAIGITNTMVMSIYERTREIGVMKVLGCELKDIRMLFLMEAGGIGLIGGTVGLLFSYTISFAINKLSASYMGDMMGTTGISQIPPWLALVGIGFSIMVGIISGYAPANRAVKISALSAIKTE